MKVIAEFIINDLPLIPNTSSTGKHWSARYKQSVKWKGLIRDKCEKHGLTNLKLNRAVFTFIRQSMKEPDYDNLVISYKPILDAFVAHGVIVDDKPSVIGKSNFEWEYRARKFGGQITVRIEA